MAELLGVDTSRNLEQELVDASKKLAGFGWTIPQAMSPREFFHISALDDEGTIDARFLNFYQRSGNSTLLGAAIGSSRFIRWRPLLRECYESYEDRRFLICIPSLITVLEGAIALPEGLRFIHDSEREAFFQNRIAGCGADMLPRALWESVHVFMSRLFQRADFAGMRPLSLNRHWILHGRDLPDWGQADAVRLFQALSTLSLIFFDA